MAKQNGALVEYTRRASSFRVGHLIAAVVVIVMALSVATQYVASSLAYQAELGSPWLHVGAVRVYAPWAFIEWAYYFDAYAPDVFTRGFYIVYAGTAAAVVAAFVVALKRSKSTRTADLHGSAHWASEDEIQASGLAEKKPGVILAVLPDGRYLIHDGAEHIEVTAPSRSGKGVSVVIPTLLNWRHSVIVNDIKGENWTLTARFRSKFSYVMKFNPSGRDTCRFNPLAEVRRGENEVKDVQNIAQMLADPDGKGLEGHWAIEGAAWLTAAIVHVLYTEPDKSLPGVSAFLDNPDRALADTLEYMLATKHVGGACHPVVAQGARALLNKSANERSGVHSTATSFLKLYQDPIIAAAVSESDFAITDLMRAKHPLSLYLISPPSDKARMRPLFRLMMAQINARLTEELNPEGNRWRLLELMDEFPSLGKLEFFEEGLGFVAGYGIKCMMFNQSDKQIIKYYGRDNTIMDGAHIHVWYTPNTDETAKRISESLGTKTEVVSTVSRGGHVLSGWLGNLMVSSSEQARALMTQDEVSRMPKTDVIVKVAGIAPIQAKKTYYYRDPSFKDRVPPTVQDGNRVGALADPAHPMNPPSDTHLRPYRYGPPRKPSQWASVARPAPAAPLASPGVARAAPAAPDGIETPKRDALATAEFAHEQKTTAASGAPDQELTQAQLATGLNDDEGLWMP